MFSVFLEILLLSTIFTTGTGNRTGNDRDDWNDVRDLNQRAPFLSPDPGQWFFADPRSCSQFIACNNGICTILICVGGRHYNPEIQWCDYKENAGCATENVNYEESAESIADTECPPNGRYTYPYPGVCSKFIQCFDGLYSVIECADGFTYNSEKGLCYYSEETSCEDSTTISTTADSSATTSELTAPATTTETTTTSTATEDPNANGGPVGICPAANGQYVHFLTDSKDCSVYYMCNWGTPIKMNCGSGLHFNPTLKVCDWPSNAGCTVK